MLSLFVNPMTFDITAFGTNLYTMLTRWGNILIIIIGVVMMLVAIWQIAKGLIQHGKAQVSWAVAIILLILGGALASFGVGGISGDSTGAWDWLMDIAKGGKNTIDQLGKPAAGG